MIQFSDEDDYADSMPIQINKKENEKQIDTLIDHLRKRKFEEEKIKKRKADLIANKKSRFAARGGLSSSPFRNTGADMSSGGFTGYGSQLNQRAMNPEKLPHLMNDLMSADTTQAPIITNPKQKKAHKYMQNTT
mmetsp:Transcript_17238/g.26618  ORF Transcript_17238/g.26618 Transcript_17238/m.26618 type:complete len:134 (+) Transcript_17238:135-536(+)